MPACVRRDSKAGVQAYQKPLSAAPHFCVADCTNRACTESTADTITDGCFYQTGGRVYNGQPVWTNGEADWIFGNTDKEAWDLCPTGTNTNSTGADRCYWKSKRMNEARQCDMDTMPGCSGGGTYPNLYGMAQDRASDKGTHANHWWVLASKPASKPQFQGARVS